MGMIGRLLDRPLLCLKGTVSPGLNLGQGGMWVSAGGWARHRRLTEQQCFVGFPVRSAKVNRSKLSYQMRTGQRRKERQVVEV